MVSNPLIIYNKQEGETSIPTDDTRFVSDKHLQIHLVGFDAESKTSTTTTWGDISSVDVWIEDGNTGKTLEYALVYQPISGTCIFKGDCTIDNNTRYSVEWSDDENKLNVTKAEAEIKFKGSGGSLLISPNIITLVGEHKYGHANYTGEKRFSSANIEDWCKKPTSKSFKIFLSGGKIRNADGTELKIIITNNNGAIPKNDDDGLDIIFTKNDDDGLDITLSNNNGTTDRTFVLTYKLQYSENESVDFLEITIIQNPLCQVVINEFKIDTKSDYSDLCLPIKVNYSTFTVNDSRLYMFSENTTAYTPDPKFELGYGTDDISFMFDDDSVISDSTELGIDSKNLDSAAYVVKKSEKNDDIEISLVDDCTVQINANTGNISFMFLEDKYPVNVSYSSCYIAVHPCYIKSIKNKLDYWSNENNIKDEIKDFLQTDKGSAINLNYDSLIYIPYIYETTLQQAQYIDFDINNIQTCSASITEYYECSGRTESYKCEDANGVIVDAKYLDVNFDTDDDLMDSLMTDDNVTSLQEEWFVPFTGITCYTECVGAEQNYQVINECKLSANAKEISVTVTPLLQKYAHAAGFTIDPISTDTVSYVILQAFGNEETCLIKCDLVLKDWEDINNSNPLSILQVRKHKEETQQITILAQSLDDTNITKKIIGINLKCPNIHAYRIKT